MPFDPLLDIPSRLAFGLIISALIGLLAYRRGSLSQSGVLGAVITGTLIFGFGGWAAGLTLIAFFVSSSLLSRFKAGNIRKQRASEIFDKGGQRDLGQALANGGGAAILALLLGLAAPNIQYYFDDPWLVLTVAMVGSLASVNADTWATELGVLSRTKPRLITTLKPVEPGTSGGISCVGLAAAFGGSVFIAMFFITVFLFVELPMTFNPGQLLVPYQPFAERIFLFAVILGGVAGALFDSFLGATAQAMYFSEKRQKETEKRFEKDGTPNKPIRGWRWLNNDWVNFISSLFGAGIAAGIAIAVAIAQ